MPIAFQDVRQIAATAPKQVVEELIASLRFWDDWTQADLASGIYRDRFEPDCQPVPRRSDDELADEIATLMSCDPWRTWSRTELAQRAGSSTGRVGRVLRGDRRFDEVGEVVGRDRWRVSRSEVVNV